MKISLTLINEFKYYYIFFFTQNNFRNKLILIIEKSF